jgi:hypothetical protein
LADGASELWPERPKRKQPMDEGLCH